MRSSTSLRAGARSLPADPAGAATVAGASDGGAPVRRPTRALLRAAVAAALLIGLAVSLGRADLAAIGAPLVFGLVLALSAGVPDRSVAPSGRARLIGTPPGGTAADIAVTVRGTAGAQFTTVAVPYPGGPGRPWAETLPGGDRTVVRSTVLPDWGPLTVVRPDVTVAGPDGLTVTPAVRAPELKITVPPRIAELDSLALAPISTGWAGEHASRRPGQGGELIDLREYAPGDRLRSIHWRAFARHQKLYVRRTQSDADADFVICVDTRVEVRPQQGPARVWQQRVSRRWGGRFDRWRDFWVGMVRVPSADPKSVEPAPRTSLDVTVHAAAAIAEAQCRVGDRVGVLDLASGKRGVRLGAGSRHLDRLRHELAAVDLQPWRPLTRVETWGLPSAAVVVVLSPLTDDAVVSAAADLQGRGHQVLVVDTLPVADLRAMALADARGAAEQAAELDLLLAEREVRLHRLRDRGLPLVQWQAGPAAVAAELQLLRRARSRR
ncbi:DUF58 domain-containing protein [Nakamurella sp. YIM 132087]|uniref:DUF58 domain-containing protein n=1 Tax=Nakamurella alba TaxID=2665158 RepID=A0A7K1FN19_9ACTN|nr:DUF58 domain-containing protein [Nakamurella alba]MTD14174.1 DUF58 domain-containing protein [Nakamurella alba]